MNPRRITAGFAMLIIIAGVSFFVTRWALDRTPASRVAPVSDPAAAAAPTLSAQQVDEFRKEAERQSREDLSKPRFTGALGEFLVARLGEARNQVPCEAISGKYRDFAPSELNFPGMSEQAICADGTVTSVCSDAIGCRRYFLGVPQVPIDAPRERLELLEVNGRPALAVRPVQTSRESTLYIIQRSPSPNTPGILLQVIAQEGGLDKAIEIARSLMGQ